MTNVAAFTKLIKTLDLEFIVDGARCLEHAQVNCEDPEFIRKLKDYLLDNTVWLDDLKAIDEEVE